MFALVQRRCFLHIVVKQNHTVPMILPVNFKPHLSAGAWQAPAWTGEASQLQRIRICYLHTVLKHFGERGREKENERKWSCGRLELKRPVCFASSVTWDRLSWNAQQHHHKQQVKKQRKLKLELAKKELKLLEDLCEGYPAARVRWLTVKHQPWHLDNLRDSFGPFCRSCCSVSHIHKTFRLWTRTSRNGIIYCDNFQLFSLPKSVGFLSALGQEEMPSATRIPRSWNAWGMPCWICYSEEGQQRRFGRCSRMFFALNSPP